MTLGHRDEDRRRHLAEVRLRPPRKDLEPLEVVIPEIDQALERRLDGVPRERVKQALAGDGGGVDHLLIQIPGRLVG